MLGELKDAATSISAPGPAEGSSPRPSSWIRGSTVGKGDGKGCGGKGYKIGRKLRGGEDGKWKFGGDFAS